MTGLLVAAPRPLARITPAVRTPPTTPDRVPPCLDLTTLAAAPAPTARTILDQALPLLGVIPLAQRLAPSQEVCTPLLAPLDRRRVEAIQAPRDLPSVAPAVDPRRPASPARSPRPRDPAAAAHTPSRASDAPGHL